MVRCRCPGLLLSCSSWVLLAACFTASFSAIAWSGGSDGFPLPLSGASAGRPVWAFPTSAGDALPMARYGRHLQDRREGPWCDATVRGCWRVVVLSNMRCAVRDAAALPFSVPVRHYSGRQSCGERSKELHLRRER